MRMDGSGSDTRRVPKRQQLIDGAYKVFMEHGFEGASVDEIARAAGASKATLYSYFPDKRQLFEAVVQSRCGQQGVICCEGTGEPIETTLRHLAQAFVRFLNSRPAQEMFRVCIAEAGRFPEAGRAFYEAGPAESRARLASFIKAAADRGELLVDDPLMAADQFSALCKTGGFLSTLLGGVPVSDAEMSRVADEAVKTFLARYAVPPRDVAS